MPVDKSDVLDVYRLLLNRVPENSRVIDTHCSLPNVQALIDVVLSSSEFQAKHPNILQPSHGMEDQTSADPFESHKNHQFRAPQDLARTETPVSAVLFVGGCMLDPLINYVSIFNPKIRVDHTVFNHATTLADAPPHNYDFQVVQVPLRSILSNPDFHRLAMDDDKTYDDLFSECMFLLDEYLSRITKWSDFLPTFVMNYMLPQQNPRGRLLSKSGMSNPITFIREINSHLAKKVRDIRNAYVLDVDEISATFGRSRAQDDAVWLTAHNALINDFDFEHDKDRIERTSPVSTYYALDLKTFCQAVWHEAVAGLRTIRQIDSVKMICVDLDDTLWRGVLAETQTVDVNMVEGWPLGLAEALMFLKNRGIILAIISKNEESRIKELWPQVYGSRITLDDFAIKKINWKPKDENIAQAMKEANLLPQSVLFLDDNPRERASVRKAFPDLRVIDAPPLLWRRILLWSPECQVVHVSAESSRRSDMIQAQNVREQSRNTFSHEDFLAQLRLKTTIRQVLSVHDSHFARIFELLNKTNQFNTTGVRWSNADCVRLFESGGCMWVFDAEDKHTHYGIVGIVISKGAVIEQLVMSCRVMGLDIETTVLSVVSEELLKDQPSLFAKLVETKANMPVRDLFQRSGWAKAECWTTDRAGPRSPFVTVKVELAESACENL